MGILGHDSLRVLSYLSPYYCVIYGDGSIRRELERLCEFSRHSIPEKFREYRAFYETIPLMAHIINLVD